MSCHLYRKKCRAFVSVLFTIWRHLIWTMRQVIVCFTGYHMIPLMSDIIALGQIIGMEINSIYSMKSVLWLRLGESWSFSHTTLSIIWLFMVMSDQIMSWDLQMLIEIELINTELCRDLYIPYYSIQYGKEKNSSSSYSSASIHWTYICLSHLFDWNDMIIIMSFFILPLCSAIWCSKARRQYFIACLHRDHHIEAIWTGKALKPGITFQLWMMKKLI